jgi:hypothetical protein
MLKLKLLPFCLFTVFLACERKAESRKFYQDQVGDTKFDEKLDDPHFKTCNKVVLQYYNFGKGLQYQGEKIKILEAFKGFNAPNSLDDTGYVTIRFIVNCEGKTGMFRIQEMSDTYETKKFSDDAITQLLNYSRSLKI